MRVEPVDPVAFAEEASSILREAWPPPALDYTPDYLVWQFQFPGSTASIGFAAYEGSRAVGFIGSTPRRLRRGDHASEAQLLSFLAVRPASRGQGVAGLLYDALLETLRRRDLPVVSYMQAGARIEGTARKAYARAGLLLREIAALPTYGYVERSLAETEPVAVTEIPEVAELATALERCADEGALHLAPDQALLQHYQRDPRSRAAFEVRDRDGRALGGGTVLLAGVATGRGVERIALIDHLFLSEPAPGIVAAVCRFAARRWPLEDGRPRRVTLPNAGSLCPVTLRAVGLRQTAPGFKAYVAARAVDHPFLGARATSLEIV